MVSKVAMTHKQTRAGGRLAALIFVAIGIVLTCDLPVLRAQTLTATHQINITTDNPNPGPDPPTGLVPFYLWWSNSGGDPSWPNYIFSDYYNSTDEPSAAYPTQDQTIRSIAAGQTNGPPASPWSKNIADWTASAPHVIGDKIHPKPSNGYTYMCIVPGNSGTAEPSFPVTAGVSVTDGTAVWTLFQPTGTEPAPAPSTQTWHQNTPYHVGDIVNPTTQNSHTYLCTQAGTTNAMTEPTWPTTIGTPVTDNTAKWVEHTPVVVVGVSSQWNADASDPVSTAQPGSSAGGDGHAVGIRYALEKKFVPGQPRQFDIWLEITNTNTTPAEIRIVYALFRKTDPDNGNLIPITAPDASGNQIIFRRLTHAGSARYVVGTTAQDSPYTITDLRVDLSSVAATDYVYLDVFAFDLTNKQANKEFGSALQMKRRRLQIQ